ncbi:MAG: aminopeptidase P N-terminal domain-containing protein [Candidatus Saccharimonas sp.]
MHEDLLQRRQALTKVLQGGLVVLAAYHEVQLTGDMAAPFMQEANVLWLTQCHEAGMKVIIDGSRDSHMVIVRPHISAVKHIFEGGMTDAALKQLTGAQEVIGQGDFEKRLRLLAKHHSVVHSITQSVDHGFISNPAQHELALLLERIFPRVVDCTKQLKALRATKSESEVAAIQKAVQVTRQAFEKIQQNLGDYRHEYEIEADMTQIIRRHNTHHAYEPIVASGANALTLHYTKNSAKLAKNHLVLIDVGARFGGYCADITRTYAVNPTKRQRAVHAAVEKAHHAIIDMIAPNVLIADYLGQVDEVMKDALQDLGLLKDRNDTATYRRYFPHAVSHGLGIDVHEGLGGSRFFTPGMVLTVEPGIYIAEESIGVRIEDDILVTPTGNKNLSGALSTKL